MLGSDGEVAMPPNVGPDSVPGTVVLPTWILVATIAFQFSVLMWVAWKVFNKYVELLERVCAAIEALEDARP